MRNYHRLLFIALLVSCSFCAFDAGADTHTAATCSLADVTSAYNASSDGDIVAVPSGNCTWNGTLTVTKLITIQGAGSNQTTIAAGSVSYPSPLIALVPHADGNQRVTGLYLYKSTLSGAPYGITIDGKITSVRIDHNKFEKMYMTITPRGWVYGSIDNNVFLNCDAGVQPLGDNNASWSRPIAAGTPNALFIEDNTFTVNNNINYEPNEQITHGQGPRTVIRYNTFDMSTYTNGNGLPIEAHGNANYYMGNSNDMRGMPIMEIYNNTMSVNHTYRFIHIRGGSNLIHDNVLTSSDGSGTAISLTEEEGWACPPVNSVFPNCRSSWPAEDQITNTFIWNNTKNGSAITDVLLANPTTDATFIQKDRDYFMHAPQSSGGKSSYGMRAGAADLTFSPSGADAYYPYTPYTHPHPLTQGGGLTLPPPQNLRITN